MLSNAEVDDAFPARGTLDVFRDKPDVVRAFNALPALVSQLPARTQASGVGLTGHESAVDMPVHGVDAGFPGGPGRGLADVFPPTSQVGKMNIAPLDPGTMDRPGNPHIGVDAGVPRGALNRNILALDLGTKAGWAIATRDGKHIGGTESFARRASWDDGQQGERFMAWLAALIDKHQVHAIAYEQVVRRLPTTQAATAHMYGGLQMLMWMVAGRRRLTVTGVGITTIKKEWTGNGAADKPMMVAEAQRRGFRPVDDNHADAIAILDWAVARELGKPLKYPPKPKAEKKKAFAERGVKRAKEQRKVKAAAAPQVSLI